MIDLTPVLVSIISVAVIVLTVCVIPWIRKKVDSEKRQELYMWTRIGVLAFEQMCKTGVINREDRKKNVIEFLEKHGFTVDMDEIDVIIESIVLELPETLIADDPDQDPSLGFVAEVEDDSAIVG